MASWLLHVLKGQQGMAVRAHGGGTANAGKVRKGSMTGVLARFGMTALLGTETPEAGAVSNRSGSGSEDNRVQVMPMLSAFLRKRPTQKEGLGRAWAGRSEKPDGAAGLSVIGTGQRKRRRDHRRRVGLDRSRPSWSSPLVDSRALASSSSSSAMRAVSRSISALSSWGPSTPAEQEEGLANRRFGRGEPL